MPQDEKTLMISTCGTSLLTNDAEPTLGKLLRDSANWGREEFNPEQRQVVSQQGNARQGQLFTCESASIRQMSAELNGLLRYYDNQIGGHGQDQHFLLHTDTFQGETVAGILETYLKAQGLSTQKLSFPDLRADSIENFHRGITDLIMWCENTLPGYRQSQYHVAFNLVGGFKSIQGWMQTLGMLYADEILYIFESGRELLRIPRIPVAIDDGARIAIEQHLELFRCLAPPHATCHVDKLMGIAEVFFYQLGNEAELSPWGRLIWERCRKEIYAAKLHDPPSEKIQFSEKFRKTANGLADKERLVQVNERLDDLALFLSEGTNLNRLDFKQLKGNPCPPSTHECDAWADKGAWRIFAHFNGKTLVLDDLGPGLH